MGSRFRIVEVTWVDSNVAHGWISTETAKKNADERPLNCRSVGYVLSEDAEDRLTLVTSLADNLQGRDVAAGDTLTIPKGAILTMRDLGAAYNAG